MKTLVASKKIGDEERHFVLVNECYLDNNEPFTLFVHANHYSVERVELDRIGFVSLEAAFEHCQREYGISRGEWQSQVWFSKDFQFKYSVTDLGVPQPYPLEFEEGQVVFRLNEREDDCGDTMMVLNVCGDRVGLLRLAAMLLLCADSERYDNFFHIHLEDKAGFILPDMPVTLRGPSYFRFLVRDELREGSTGTVVVE